MRDDIVPKALVTFYLARFAPFTVMAGWTISADHQSTKWSNFLQRCISHSADIFRQFSPIVVAPQVCFDQAPIVDLNWSDDGVPRDQLRVGIGSTQHTVA